MGLLALFGPPDVDKMKEKKNVKGLIKGNCSDLRPRICAKQGKTAGIGVLP